MCCVIFHNCSAVRHAYEFMKVEHSKRGFESRLKHTVPCGFSLWSFLDCLGLAVDPRSFSNVLMIQILEQVRRTEENLCNSRREPQNLCQESANCIHAYRIFIKRRWVGTGLAYIYSLLQALSLPHNLKTLYFVYLKYILNFINYDYQIFVDRMT